MPELTCANCGWYKTPPEDKLSDLGRCKAACPQAVGINIVGVWPTVRANEPICGAFESLEKVKILREGKRR